jgi:hypothetical protein
MPLCRSCGRSSGKTRKSSKFFKRRPEFADSAAPPAPLLVDDIWASAQMAEHQIAQQQPFDPPSPEAMAALKLAQSTPDAESLEGARSSLFFFPVITLLLSYSSSLLLL